MIEKKRLSSAQWSLALLIFALAAARLAYGFIGENGLRETAALFIGLPALLAIIITLTPRAKSVTGMVIKGIIIAMLMSGILLQEGFICVLMAAPLFLAVGLIVGKLADLSRSSEHKAAGLLLIPFLFLSLEGTSESLSFAREQVVVVERVMPVNEEAIAHLLAETPAFEQPLPLFLQLGFPQPVHASGSGLALGDERVVTFANGDREMGQLVLVVKERGKNQVQFQAVNDSTPIAEWLRWQTTEVAWEAASDKETMVTFTVTTERRLAPAIYFGPLEHYGVNQAAAYLADSLLALDMGD